MRPIITMALKDFKIMVFNPMFCIIAALCTSIWSYNYLRSLMAFAKASAIPSMYGGANSMNLHYQVFVQHISFMNLIFIFAVPAITMRLLSEEKKNRTFDLLLTSPISSADIALGKFFAGWISVGVLVLLSFIYPLMTTMFADFSWAPVFTSYLGVMFIAGLYVAAGLFASSLTQSVVLSVIMGVIFNLVLWFISQGVEFSDEATFTAIMQHLNIGQHFFSFLKGTLAVGSILFFVSFISLFVFLSERVVESSRWR